MTELIKPDIVAAFILILLRISSFMISFPLINTSLIPTNVKILLMLAVSFYISNIVGIAIPVEKISLLDYFILSVKEVLLGFCLGLVVNIFIAAFSYAAEIISYSMGLTIVNIFDPTFGMISILDRFFIITFYLVFFITGSYKIVIGSAIMSFKLIPIIGAKANFESIFPFLIKSSSLIFSLAFKIAFPFILVLFIVNLGLALINRLIPQINVFIVGLPLQVFIGLAALSLGFSAIMYSGALLIDKLNNTYLTTIKTISR